MKTKEEIIKDILDEFSMKWPQEDMYRLSYEWRKIRKTSEMPSLKELAEHVAKQRNLIKT